MKKVLISIQILINIVILFFIPIVPSVFIGGMQSNGHIYTESTYSTMFNVFIERKSGIADANYYFNDKILIIELITLIIINIVFFIMYRKYYLNKREAGENNE